MIQKHGAPMTLNRVGSMFTLFFSPTPIQTYADVMACDTEAFGRFFHFALERGVYLPPSQFEAAFISAAHTDDDLDRLATVLEAFLTPAIN